MIIRPRTYTLRDVDAPIGIFDSGVGGLTVARAVLDQLPHEPIVYVGDTAHSPYGPRPIAEVRALALEILDSLVHQHDVKMLVIACNAASSACLRDARERYAPLPVVEVIQPAVRRAVAATRNGRIGVLGTQVTIGSRSYDDAFAAAPHVELTTVPCPRFVEFVEAGETWGEELLAAAEHYLQPIIDAGCDTVVLGCTHYPLLTGVISYVLGDDVTLVSSAEETAKDVYRGLAHGNLFRDESLPPPRHHFLATGDPAPFQRLGRRFLGPEVGEVAQARRSPELMRTSAATGIGVGAAS
jgi:glutamate racemase